MAADSRCVLPHFQWRHLALRPINELISAAWLFRDGFIRKYKVTLYHITNIVNMLWTNKYIISQYPFGKMIVAS